MPIAVLGVSHHTAPVDVRERFVFPAQSGERALAVLTGAGNALEAVLLSTCNRTELYLHLPSEDTGLEPAEDLLAAQAGLGRKEALCYMYAHRGRSAVEHLFRVVGSLDSMVLGEAQIQGQVRTAYESARDLGGEPRLVGPVLGRLFDAALGVGGRIRSETRLGEGAASIASAAVELARKIFGSLRDRSAVVIGAGEMSELALQCFAAEGLRRIDVANRSAERARELATRIGGQPVPYTEVWRRVAEADILLTATGAPHRILTRERLEAALPGGPRRPLFILDIALPRDVDAAVGKVDNVFLYDIDDLQQIVGSNLERRREEVPAAETIIRDEVEAFWSWYVSLDVVPVIRSLRDRGESLRRAELARAMRKLSHLSESDRREVERLTRQLLNKILHEPTIRLKEAAGNGRGPLVVDAARYLFELDAGRPDRSSTPGDAEAETADDAPSDADAASPPRAPHDPEAEAADAAPADAEAPSRPAARHDAEAETADEASADAEAPLPPRARHDH